MLNSKKAPKMVIPVARRTSTSSISSPTPKKKVKKLSRVVPKADLENIGASTLIFTTHTSANNEEIVIVMSRPFNEIPPKDSRNAFKQKCKECMKICNFSDPNQDSKAKNAKTTLLKHIISAFTIPHVSRSLSNEMFSIFYQMVSSNLFREFPYLVQAGTSDFRSNHQDSAWIHISLVYEALVASFSLAPSAELPQDFVSKLLMNVLSPDDRERTIVSGLLSSIYTKHINQRSVIRQKVFSIFISRYCSSELLEIAISIISSYPAPLKPDAINVYATVILPLHTFTEFPNYSRNLFQCISRMIAKSDQMFNVTINYLITHWPLSDRSKQLIYLHELSELIIAYNSLVKPVHLNRFFTLVSECFNDLCSSIADAAIDLFQNNLFFDYLRGTSNIYFFQIVTSAYNCSKSHWDDEIRDSATSLLENLETIDGSQYKKTIDAQKMMKSRKKAAFALCKSNWSKVYEGAKVFDGNVELPDMALLK